MLALSLLSDARGELLTEKVDISVVLTCGDVPCTVVLKGAVRGAGKLDPLTARPVAIGRGGSRRARLDTTPAVRSAVGGALRRKKKVSVLVTAIATAADGAQQTKSITLKVRAKPKKRAARRPRG